uniref:Uncharacterized protein n=1 Tax=Theropithecus gelada TaxID=9565 RepID=A0A8D2ELW7_THEGE
MLVNCAFCYLYIKPEQQLVLRTIATLVFALYSIWLYGTYVYQIQKETSALKKIIYI